MQMARAALSLMNRRQLLWRLVLAISAFLVQSCAPDAPPHIDGPQWLQERPIWRSTQLGVDVHFIPYSFVSDGYSAARVAGAPAADSPASRVRFEDDGQIRALEPADLILAMDELVFYNLADFDGHFEESTIYIRDGRTGRFRKGSVSLPARTTPSSVVSRPQAFVPRQFSDRETQRKTAEKLPFARSQLELRALLLQSIEDGEVLLTPPAKWEHSKSIQYSRGGCYFKDEVHSTVRDQAAAESFRKFVVDPGWQEYLRPAVTNVEELIERKLEFLNLDQGDEISKQRLDQQIDFQYLCAVATAVSAEGQSIPDVEPPSNADSDSSAKTASYAFGVRFLSKRNAVSLLYMPRLNWWIITRSQRRQPKDQEWLTCKLGEYVNMTGFYAYRARYADGTLDSAREDLHITQPGDWTLP
jgi:hypothetical protein